MDLRQGLFLELAQEVGACVTCRRMQCSQRVIGHANGRLDAPLMFIGEAPGRLGADQSAIPFHGDRAGDNFENLLEQVSLSRYECFITNAVLCNPKDENGNNSTPNREELLNCSSFLRRQMDIVQPSIVVTLGAQALLGLKHIESHDINLADGVRRQYHWYNRFLIPLYHPGQRAMLHRSFLNQLADYQFVAEAYRRLNKERRQGTARPAAEVASAIVQQLLQLCGELSYFSVHKLYYLIECEHYRTVGKRLSSCYIVRQKDGPYVTDLNIKRLKKALPELKTRMINGSLLLSLKATAPLFSILSATLGGGPNSGIVSTVAKKYGRLSDAKLKHAVYMTTPMRRILRREKYGRENMFNAAIDFSSLT